MKILDASSLQDAMEQRAKHYDKLRDQFTSLKRAFQEMIDLDDFEGKGAEAIKGFYQGQIEVVEAWQRLFDRQIAFFEGVSGKLEDKDLGSNSRIETAFLEEDLVQKERQADEMITEQRRALENIFRDIDDLVPLHPFSRSQFDDLMMDASKKRIKTMDAVEEVDQELKDEYMSSEGEEAYAIQLFSALLGATKQGSSISPIQFDAEAYHQSDIYKLKGEAEEATISYLTYKQQEQEAREIAERPVVEKVWDGVKTFVGEFTGYYDYKRAVEGVDPVTGEKMSTAQRIAAGGMALAGFIPIVGWAGRAVKGGKGIYSAAKGINAAENAMSTYKNVQAFSTLEKTEMGIYGLLSANGLSEYTTGKDMFGNELTAEQRQASLTQSIFAGLPFVPGMAKEAGKLGQQALNSTVQIGKQGADVSRAFMDDLGRSLNTGPNVAFAGGVGDVSSYLKAESRADGVGKVSGDKESYLSMLSGSSGDVVKGTGKVYPTRQIDSVTEAHIIDRVKELRGNLSSKYKKSGNFALAEVDVNSLNKKEFYASSKIDEFKGDLEEKVPEISLKPNEPIFEASLAPGKDGKPFMRDSDTEYKILNEIALKLGDDVNATGKIKLFTELDTCDSCSKVIAEFANKYKNIELEVIHNNGERLKP